MHETFGLACGVLFRKPLQTNMSGQGCFTSIRSPLHMEEKTHFGQWLSALGAAELVLTQPLSKHGQRQTMFSIVSEIKVKCRAGLSRFYEQP